MIVMGKQKNRLVRASRAYDRELALQEDMVRQGVKHPWDLPPRSHWYHRAVRLQAVKI